MRLKKWKILRKKTLINTKWINVSQEKVKLPNNKILDDYFLINYSDWVLAIVQNEKEEFLICSLYRHGSKKISFEFCGGIIDKGETPLSSIRQELREETGYTGGTFKKIGKLSPNPANHTNFNHIFYVTGGKITEKQNLDDSEAINFEWVSEIKLRNLIKQGKFDHSLHLAALQIFNLFFNKALL